MSLTYVCMYLLMYSGSCTRTTTTSGQQQRQCFNLRIFSHFARCINARLVCVCVFFFLRTVCRSVVALDTSSPFHSPFYKICMRSSTFDLIESNLTWVSRFDKCRKVSQMTGTFFRLQTSFSFY